MNIIPSDIITQTNILFLTASVQPPNSTQCDAASRYVHQNRTLYKCNSISNDTINRMKLLDQVDLYPFVVPNQIKIAFGSTYSELEQYYGVLLAMQKKINVKYENVICDFLMYRNNDQVFCFFCQKNHSFDEMDNGGLNLQLQHCLKKKLEAYNNNSCPYCPSVNITAEEKNLHILTTGHYNNFYQGFIIDSKNYMNNVNILSTKNQTYTNLLFIYDYIKYQKFLNKIKIHDAIKELIAKQTSHYQRDQFNIRTWLNVIITTLDNIGSDVIPCDNCLQDLNIVSPISLGAIINASTHFVMMPCECGSQTAYTYDNHMKHYFKALFSCQKKKVTITAAPVNEVSAEKKTTDNRTSYNITAEVREKIFFNSVYKGENTQKFNILVNRYGAELLQFAYKNLEKDFLQYMTFINDYVYGGFIHPSHQDLAIIDTRKEELFIYYFYLVHCKFVVINLNRLPMTRYEALCAKYGYSNIFIMMGENISKHQIFYTNLTTDRKDDPIMVYEDILFNILNSRWQPMDAENQGDTHERDRQSQNNAIGGDQPQNPHAPTKKMTEDEFIEFKLIQECRLDEPMTIAARKKINGALLNKYHPDKALQSFFLDAQANGTTAEDVMKTAAYAEKKNFYSRHFDILKKLLDKHKAENPAK